MRSPLGQFSIVDKNKRGKYLKLVKREGKLRVSCVWDFCSLHWIVVVSNFEVAALLSASDP